MIQGKRILKRQRMAIVCAMVLLSIRMREQPISS